MRAYRTIDGSFHTWRAGEFDTDMSETTPPHPKGEYSDFVVLSHIGGPLARSDAEAFPFPGLGTSGAPITFSQAPVPSVNTDPGIDCQDYSSVTVFITITTPGTAALATVLGAWSGVDAAALAADVTAQRSDDSIAAGVSPQNQYQATYTMPTPVGVAPVLGPFNLPVRGRRFFLAVMFDTADVEGFVTVMRLA
jgi:hypothetical protein